MDIGRSQPHSPLRLGSATKRLDYFLTAANVHSKLAPRPRVLFAVVTGVALFAAIILAGHVGPIPWIVDTNSLVIAGRESTNAQDADPLIAHTVESYVESHNATGTAVGAEITGYLVDWVIRISNPDGGSEIGIVEFVVMKDGSLYRYPLRGAADPAAFWGNKPAARLEPESSKEAKEREDALAVAQQKVAKRFPRFAAAKPELFKYFLTVTFADGSSVEVMADPSGDRPPRVNAIDMIEFDPATPQR